MSGIYAWGAAIMALQGPYEFTNDWFSANIEAWKRIFAAHGAPARVLEIGSYEGRSTVWIVENLMTQGSGIVVAVNSGRTFHQMTFQKVRIPAECNSSNSGSTTTFASRLSVTQMRVSKNTKVPRLSSYRPSLRVATMLPSISSTSMAATAHRTC